LITDLKPLRFEQNVLTILDQRKLPNAEIWIPISHSEALWEAIQTLAIRGAPLLGFAGLIGVYFSLLETDNEPDWMNRIDILRSVRPTAVNLAREVTKAVSILSGISKKQQRINECLRLIQTAAVNSIKECESIADFGCSLLQDGDGLFTHCNTGSLASIGIGTALGIIKKAYFTKKNIRVYHTETRPLWQGARLTAYELMKCEIPAVMVIDSAISTLMASGNITKVIVGADRIALNGDTANKIGTLSLALSAHYYRIPFYVAAPTSTFDTQLRNGSEIPIELRNQQEVLMCEEKKLAPSATKVWNPAFDVTPKELINAFITELGINP
jgi:methylthioribose-1-phosphate isomerase